MKFKLVEKWYKGRDYAERIWWSDSAIEFKNFIANAAAQGDSQAYRLLVGPNTYAAANAMDMNHDNMGELLDSLYLPIGNAAYTLGIPTMFNFDMGNYELDYCYSDYADWLKGKSPNFADHWLFSTDIKEEDIPRDLSKEGFIKWYSSIPHKYASKWHTVQFQGFEVSVFNRTEAEFKRTALYKALKPLYVKW